MCCWGETMWRIKAVSAKYLVLVWCYVATLGKWRGVWFSDTDDFVASADLHPLKYGTSNVCPLPDRRGQEASCLTELELICPCTSTPEVVHAQQCRNGFLSAILGSLSGWGTHCTRYASRGGHNCTPGAPLGREK
jgi:hypothetical protein